MPKFDIDFTALERLEKNKGGRPPLWNTPEELEEQLDGFFQWCQDENFIPDVEGLGVYTNTNRQRFHEYEKKDGFQDIIKRFKNHIAFYKKQLAFSGQVNPTVFIFDAKNNHGYVEKSEVVETKEILIGDDE